MSLLDDEDILITNAAEDVKNYIDTRVAKILYISKKDLWQCSSDSVEFNGNINNTSYIPTVLSDDPLFINNIQQPELAFDNSFTQNGSIKIPGLNVTYNSYNIQTYMNARTPDIMALLGEIGVKHIKFPSFIDKMYYIGPVCYNGPIKNGDNIKIIRELNILGRNSKCTDFNLLPIQFPSLTIIYDLYITGMLYLNNDNPIKNIHIHNIILQSDIGEPGGMAGFNYGPFEGRFIHMTIDEFIVKLGYARGRNIKNMDINKIRDMDTFKVLSLVHMLIEFFKNNPCIKDIFYKDISIKSLIYYYYDHSEI